MAQLFAAKRKKHEPQEYCDRLEREIEIIKKMGFPGYFLVVWDFIKYAKDHGIPVGPGRGSAAGSLVAYSLGITDVDPLEYDLLFERFLNPERISMPDIDIDFCMNRRGEVIDYVRKKYGEENVAQIITFGTMAAKSVVRDVGRVLGHQYALRRQDLEDDPGRSGRHAHRREEGLAAARRGDQERRGSGEDHRDRREARRALAPRRHARRGRRHHARAGHELRPAVPHEPR